MKTYVRVGLVIGAVVLFGGAAAGQESPEDVRRRRESDERNIDRICNSARIAYRDLQAAHARFVDKLRDPRFRSQITGSPEEAQRAVRDSRAQVDEARETYCECLRKNYAKAGQLMPSEYERLCRGELEPQDPEFPPEPPEPRTGYPEAPAGERSVACAPERARYIQARQRYIDAGQPSSGREAERAFKEVPAAGFAYCDCMRRLYRPVPLEVAMFCAGFDEMRRPWPPLGPGVAPEQPPKDDKPLKAADTVCAAEFQKYNGLYQRLQALPRESPERPELQRNTDAAFKELCECLRLKAPDKWRALCGEPMSSGPTQGPSGTSGPKPSKPNEPPPPPVPPPPPGAGPGSGGAGPGTGTPPVPPEPRAPAPPGPTEVSLAPCATEGATTNVAATVISHPDNHAHNYCTNYLNRIKRVVFSQVLPTTMALAVQDLPGPLVCSVSPPGCTGSCEATFPQLAGQSNVTVRLDNLVLSSGRFQGTLSFGFPGAPFVVGLASP